MIHENLAEKHPLSPPQQLNSDIYLDWVYPFHAISSNFASVGRKDPPPRGQTGKFF